jgi:hypothetical protein
MRGACWKLRDYTRKRDKLILLFDPASKPTNKLVSSHSELSWCWDKPRATLDSLNSPKPALGGNHHLPPYSILYITLSHLHSNGTFSQDSQSGVQKLSQFRLPRVWAFITSCSDLQLGWGLMQTCSSLWELFNVVSCSTCTHRGRVDSRLLVIGSQTTNLTLGPSFDHNLCCRCPNGSCETILNIYTSRPFQWYKEHLNVRCFEPCNRALNFWESGRTPKSHFRECEWQPHTSLKVGLRHKRWLKEVFKLRGWLDRYVNIRNHQKSNSNKGHVIWSST